ncbi:pepsinogen A [Coprinopsis cinerea okayama7|uniref:Pepsinogen A n=1 Tax=Coprinopsis cinerea (strain Okayama-7 / 130 / ATCC MYA-4618 / FGSC 9003) TaxID=240176 RepID=A8N6S9_COPC7|nr:pepsinogen A [Coprinopsis cinerea okayama7\|eukprot:XP_001830535.2 pepsinogen A [Coprinopsis cinerea okayama7\
MVYFTLTWLWVHLTILSYQTTARPAQNGRFIAIFQQRSMRQKPPLHTTPEARLFDAALAKQELRSLLSKYEQAAKVLAGVGLSPNGPPDISHTFPVNPLSNVLRPHPGSDSSKVYADDVPLIPPILTETTAVLPLIDDIDGTLDVLYYGPLDFGTPPQRLTVDIDTGSADLWIPGDECRECTNKQFVPSRSTTFNSSQSESFQISYGSGDVVGTVVTDVVSIQGLKIEDQTFALITSESLDFTGYPNDGLLGLAFGTISQTNKPTFFENLIRRKHVGLPLFSIHLARNQQSGSEVCFGCYDGSKAVGPISWLPVVSKTYWTLSLDNIAVNSEGNSIATQLVAAIDTGTTLIYLPDDIALNFYKLVGCFVKDFGLY